MEIFKLILDFLSTMAEFALHVDRHLFELVAQYGPWVYLLLFVIIFCETGLVVTPFLPGDSLLFASGALAGAGYFSLPLLLVLILGAAVLGDSVNYRIGHYLGPPVFEKDHRFLKRKHLWAARDFYEKHGGKAIILARFVPIIRTFAPFVAGVAGMHQGRFLMFNVTGAVLWVLGFVSAGFFFGNLSWVQKNFTLIIYLIILVSVMPVVIEIIRGLRRGKKEKGAGQ